MKALFHLLARKWCPVVRMAVIGGYHVWLRQTIPSCSDNQSHSRLTFKGKRQLAASSARPWWYVSMTCVLAKVVIHSSVKGPRRWHHCFMRSTSDGNYLGLGEGGTVFQNRTAPLQMFATLKIRGCINTKLLCSSGVQAGRRQEREGEGEGSIQAKTREESLSSLGNYF